MYLKRLELSGFKSFAKKTVLDLDNKITSIVGPNGSGKSNVAEGMRFVLGEQSMKSLRGKSGTDLIFKGSKTQGALGRASVSIVFDNTKRIFQKNDNADSNISVDFDEIIISREVYGDGSNKYLVNGSQVRLKDILELLAPLNIGSSGHHIISQGQADNILNSSIKDRKEMIEDALGLRVYQYKIAESERKLEKTNENIKEAESLRREIAPHINFLKKQVEKINKAKEMQEELKSLYREYFKIEEIYINEEEGKLETDLKVKDELREIDEKIALLKRELSLSPENQEIESKERRAEETLQYVRNKRDELSRKMGRLEGMIELEEEMVKERVSGAQGLGPEMVGLHEIESISKEVDEMTSKAIREKDISFFIDTLEKIREMLVSFVKIKKGRDTEKFKEKTEEKLKALRSESFEIKGELEKCVVSESELISEIEGIKKSKDSAKESLRDKERAFFEESSRRSEISSRVGIISMKEDKLSSEKADFSRELSEAVVLVGEDVKDYMMMADTNENTRPDQEARRKKIERIKIRLEDAGLGSVEETVKEFEEVEKRDKFLETEIVDLKASKLSLEELMKELKEKLSVLFKEGVDKINTQFTEYFSKMFGGGTAKLALIKREKRKYSEDIEGEEAGNLLDDKDKEFEEGIDIGVSLPQKKIKDLGMLSGGERALTSIALLFAITQVNPPPFLVLDETDAALDESNSRKYGDMVEDLSKFSNLVVITHNRETMSRANVLYGVTMGGDGTSKLLSVKFDEATAFAK